jgi:hypothetical protein
MTTTFVAAGRGVVHAVLMALEAEAKVAAHYRVIADDRHPPISRHRSIRRKSMRVSGSRSRSQSDSCSPRPARTAIESLSRPSQQLRQLCDVDGDAPGYRLWALRKLYGATAIAEISIFASRGKRATSTAARAGGAFLKYVA